MTYTIPIQLIDESKAPTVKAQRLTVYLPDQLPDAATVIIATEAEEERPGYKAKIYREIELPTDQVAACFMLRGLKVVVDPDKAASLLALFNYKPVEPQP